MSPRQEVILKHWLEWKNVVVTIGFVLIFVIGLYFRLTASMESNIQLVRDMVIVKREVADFKAALQGEVVDLKRLIAINSTILQHHENRMTKTEDRLDKHLDK